LRIEELLFKHAQDKCFFRRRFE